MSLTAMVLFVAGLVALVVGAELLVRGGARLAAALGISPLVIGLTVVAFGTSAPELAVSVASGLSGKPDLAVGNVVGSNIFNVLVILGLSALVAPLAVSGQLIRFDVPLMIGASVLLLLMGLDGAIGRADGAVLFAVLVAYVAFSIRQSRRENRAVREQYARQFGGGDGRGRLAPADGWIPAFAGMTGRLGPAARLAVQLALIAGGLVLLVVGSRWLVEGAISLARVMGVGEVLIGLTIVAAGTSLPELATSLVAALRGQRDIAVGNVVGSNLFNILGILGLASLVTPGGLRVAPGLLEFDIPVMIAVAVACLPIFFTGGEISRWEGALLLAYYAAYTAHLALDASRSGALATFRTAMLVFVLPLTLIALGASSYRALRSGRKRPGS
jgi:cation:H+ antiporter